MTEAVPQARTWQLLNILADGEFHSGEALAHRIGVSRASIFNALVDVAEYGVELQRIRGRGYRLAHPWQQLAPDEVLRRMGKDAGQFCIEVLPQAASSNTLLMQQASRGAPSGSVLAVELQTAGRGRLGRSWYAGLGTALMFSLLWRFERGLNTLSGLSLAVGVAIVRTLHKVGAQGVHLKWPNDVVTAQGKLAGVLIEAQGDMLGPSAVVIGIGLNCFLPVALVQKIDQRAVALEDVCPSPPTRNELLAGLLQELASVLRQFAQEGFAALRAEWEEYHFYQDQPVQLRLADGGIVSGIARGVSDSGELCLETDLGMRHCNSGEVTGWVR